MLFERERETMEGETFPRFCLCALSQKVEPSKLSHRLLLFSKVSNFQFFPLVKSSPPHPTFSPFFFFFFRLLENENFVKLCLFFLWTKGFPNGICNFLIWFSFLRTIIYLKSQTKHNFKFHPKNRDSTLNENWPFIFRNYRISHFDFYILNFH